MKNERGWECKEPRKGRNLTKYGKGKTRLKLERKKTESRKEDEQAK